MPSNRFEEPLGGKELTAIKKKMLALSGADRDAYVARQLSEVHYLQRPYAADQLGLSMDKKTKDAISEYDQKTDMKLAGTTVGITGGLAAAAYATSFLFPPLGAALALGTFVYLGHELVASEKSSWASKVANKLGLLKEDKNTLRNRVEGGFKDKRAEEAKLQPGSTARAATKSFSSSFPDMRQNFQTVSPQNAARQKPLGPPKPIVLSQTDMTRLKAMEEANLISPGTMPTATRFDGVKIPVVRPPAMKH